MSEYLIDRKLSYIKDNISEVKERVRQAAVKSGRNPEDINIIAVTKTIDLERIFAAVDKGLIHLGENRVQELIEKYESLNNSCSWHLIGHLQTNKVKYIIDKVSLIHSVDRLELAEEIQKRAEKIDKISQVLVQVNIAGEESKFGIAPRETLDFISEISQFRNIRVKGLMTVAPLVNNPEEIRYVFRELRKIFIDINEKKIDNINMEFLSMGMSNDFEVAIEEGSNMVRIGTAIFGKRNYNQ